MSTKLHKTQSIKTTDLLYNEKAFAKKRLDPKFIAVAATTMRDESSFTQEHLTALSDELEQQIQQIKQGNLENLDEYLYSQAVALHQLFYRFFRTSLLRGPWLEESKVFADLALKAQNQSRKTLLALAEIKNPKRATFIKQQNNAINQQINNSENFSDKNKEKTVNELLKEPTHETLDTRGTTETISLNPSVATVEAVYRSKDIDW